MWNRTTWIEKVNKKAIEELRQIAGTGNLIILQLVAGRDMLVKLESVDEDGNIVFGEVQEDVGGGKIIKRLHTNYLRVVYWGRKTEERLKG